MSKASRKSRQKARQDRKSAKIANRQSNKSSRISGRTEKAFNRQKSKQTAYENGIDPNAWISDSIASGASIVGDLSGAGVFGDAVKGIGGGGSGKGGGSKEGGGGSGGGTPSSPLSSMSPMMMGGLALGAYFLFMKK